MWKSSRIQTNDSQISISPGSEYHEMENIFLHTLCISIKITHSQLYPLFPFCYHLWVTGPYQGIAGWVFFSEGKLIYTACFWGHETLGFTYTGILPPYWTEPLLLVANAPCTTMGSAPLGIWTSQARGCSANTEQLCGAHTGKLSFSYIQGVWDYLFRETICESYPFWTIWHQ